MKFMTLWTDDWLAGTHPLTPEERGVLITIVCHFTNKDRVFPDDDIYVARLCNVSTRAYRRIKNTLIIGDYISIKDGHIWVEKSSSQFVKDQSYSKKQAEKAKLKRRYSKANALETNKTDDAPVKPSLPLPLLNSSKEEEYREPKDIILSAYNLFVDTAKRLNLSVPSKLSDGRKRVIKARLKEFDFESWEKAIENISTSDFLRGKVKPQNGHPVFKLNIDWFCKPGNFIKIYEGNYNEDKPKRKRL